MDEWVDGEKERSIIGIGSHDFGGWEVPRSAVSKHKTQESQWCKFQSEI